MLKLETNVVIAGDMFTVSCKGLFTPSKSVNESEKIKE